MGNDYILTHSLCEKCMYSEKGFYNPVCVHCPYATFSKSVEPRFMTKEVAACLERVKADAQNV